jgi:hypothetical protein
VHSLWHSEETDVDMIEDRSSAAAATNKRAPLPGLVSCIVDPQIANESLGFGIIIRRKSPAGSRDPGFLDEIGMRPRRPRALRLSVATCTAVASLVAYRVDRHCEGLREMVEPVLVWGAFMEM